MTTNTAHWNTGATAPRRVRATIWWWTVSLKRLWLRSRSRTDLANLGDYALRDIGIEPRGSRFGTPSGWAVAARAGMAGPYFLGR
jgi:uncharacterized protein YjiS (DUF1127 family)